MLKKIGLKQMLVGVGAILLCVYIYTTSSGKITPTINVLNNTAEQINKTCPKTIGYGTQLDSVTVLSEPRLTFNFNYTMVNLQADSVDIDSMWNEFRPIQINNTKTNRDMQYLRESKVSVGYIYHDKNGAFLFDVVVTPELYSTN